MTTTPHLTAPWQERYTWLHREAARVRARLKEASEASKFSTAALAGESPAWRANPQLTFSDGVLFVDASRQHVTPECWEILLSVLRDATDNAAVMKAMHHGEEVNVTERRIVGHTWWRLAAANEKVAHPSFEAVAQEWRRLRQTVQQRTASQRFDHVVNLGIGGSDLGPALVTEALRPFAPKGSAQGRFVANVDGDDLMDALHDLDPSRTLVVVVSKTFTTVETMRNFRSVRTWLRAHGCDDTTQTIAVTSSPERASAEGIDQTAIFNMLTLTGGRFSVWSPVGITCALTLGWDAFEAFVKGGRAMDIHTIATSGASGASEASGEASIPFILAALEIWNRNFLGFPTRGVIPYAHRLGLWPFYLQQLEMESNGKSWRMGLRSSKTTLHETHATRASHAISLDDRGDHGGRGDHEPTDDSNRDTATAPVVWGARGTNGQHAFFQALHQGSDIVPCEFFIGVQRQPSLSMRGQPLDSDALDDHHHQLWANVMAQAEAFWKGRAAPSTSEPWRLFSGGRPVTVVTFPQLTPDVMGRLIAAYEHKVAILGSWWDVPSFDQWGVELGKDIATRLYPTVKKELQRELSKDKNQEQLQEEDKGLQHLFSFLRRHRTP